MSAPLPAPLASRLGSVASERLRLVPLVPADAGDLRTVTDDPAITGAISFLSSPFTDANARALIRKGQGESDCFFAIRDTAGRLAGVIGAHLRGGDDVEIGYWIGGTHAGSGIATEATRALVARLRERLSDRRIVAECRPDNRVSWHILEKVGFRPTGTPGERPGRQLLAYHDRPDET